MWGRTTCIIWLNDDFSCIRMTFLHCIKILLDYRCHLHMILARVSLDYIINKWILKSTDLHINFLPYLHKSQQTHDFLTIIINLSLPNSHLEKHFVCGLEPYTWWVDLFSLTAYFFLYQKTAPWHVDDVKHSVRPHMIYSAPQTSWLQLYPCYLKILLHWIFSVKAKLFSWKWGTS